jgi:hypothetical protein
MSALTSNFIANSEVQTRCERTRIGYAMRRFHPLATCAAGSLDGETPHYSRKETGIVRGVGFIGKFSRLLGLCCSVETEPLQPRTSSRTSA